MFLRPDQVGHTPTSAARTLNFWGQGRIEGDKVRQTGLVPKDRIGGIPEEENRDMSLKTLFSEFGLRCLASPGIILPR
jgi:hypothetical protein